MLIGVRKPEILWNKFKVPAFKRGYKVFRKEKKEENEVMIYIFLEIRELVLMVIINFRFCL